MNHATNLATNLASIFRKWMLLPVVLVACFAGLGGCQDAFVARDIYYDNSTDKTRGTTVVLVALSGTELESVTAPNATNANPKKRGQALKDLLEKEWKGRSVLHTLAEPKRDHKLLGSDDPLWKSFRKGMDSRNRPLEWCAVFVVDMDWKEEDRWWDAYRGGPEDEIPTDLPAVDFQWQRKPVGGGGPVCISKRKSGPGAP